MALIIRQTLGENVDQQLKAVEEYFIDKVKPIIFNPYEEGCHLIMSERSFEEACYVLEESGVMNPKMLTVFEFQSKIMFLQRKVQKLNSKL